MAFSIGDDRLLLDGRPVEFIKSIFGGGGFGAGHPRILVMHFTFGASGRSSASWFRDPANPGSSAHLVVDRDGSVIQCVPFNSIAWHAGKSNWKSKLGKDLVGLNSFALSIELANWGYLRRQGNDWFSHTGVKIADPVMAAHRNGNPDGSRDPIGWEPYPAAQIAAATDIARELIAAYKLDEVIGHDDISVGRKWDPGPAFDMRLFRARLFPDRGEDGDARVVVTASDGLNLRKGPSVESAAIKLLPAGTMLQPLERTGLWLSVTVIDQAGKPTDTGWVHSHFVADSKPK